MWPDEGFQIYDTKLIEERKAKRQERKKNSDSIDIRSRIKIK